MVEFIITQCLANTDRTLTARKRALLPAAMMAGVTPGVVATSVKFDLARPPTNCGIEVTGRPRYTVSASILCFMW